MEKIRWTELERNEVLNTAVRYYNQGGYAPIAALRQSQQLVLVPHRRRKLLSHSAAPDLIKLLKQRASQGIPKQKDVVIPVQQETKAPAP